MEITKDLVEKYWPLTNVVIGEKLKQIPGVERKVGVLTSAEGKFTYKIADPWKSKEALDIDLKMFDFLAVQNFKYITKLLKTKDNNNYIQIENNFIYILQFVDGKHPDETPENYKRLGEITAELHSIKNCPYETKFSANYIVQHNLIDNAKKLSLPDEYLELVKQQPDYDQFPKTIIHSDIGPGNSIQRPDGEIILIDWDDTGVGTTILDLGYPLIQQFVSEDLEFKEEKGRAFYQAYFKHRKLSELEMDHIFDAALFYSLFYIEFGDSKKRWERIKWALENKDKLTNLYK